jgi:prepilin-type N-terminal cleavage/methylation domain-containing protein
MQKLMRRALALRLAREESGMTLVELAIVLILIGILLAIAVPSYLGLKDRTTKSAAKSNLRNVLPAVVLYGSDNTPQSVNDPNADPTDQGYENMSPLSLQAKYDPTLDVAKYAIAGATSNDYCIYTWVDAWTAYRKGPSGQIGVVLNSSFNPSSCS